MGERLWWAFGSVCAAWVVLKVVVTVWCAIELRRKWRAVPEMWGADWLDIVGRIEQAFGVTLTATDFAGWPEDALIGLTAGQLWELVAGKLQASGAPTPADGWDRVATALSEALSVRTDQIATGSRLYADLGMVYGLD